MATTETTVETSSTLTDLGLLILRIGVGAAIIQAGLIKAFDFSTTVGFMESGGWNLPTFAALMVTVAETAGGIGLILGVLTPLAACAVVGAMICAWAVNVFGGGVLVGTLQRAVLAVHRRGDPAVHRRGRPLGRRQGVRQAALVTQNRRRTARAGVRRGDSDLDPAERRKSDPLQLNGVIAGQLLASSFGPYPAVRIATTFPNRDSKIP